jgi:hypothetical protein
MRSPYFLSIFLGILCFIACTKRDEFTSDPAARLEFSADSILFDTVFTSTGSVTQRIKIFNLSDKAIRITQIKLEGGSASNYQMNVNGVPATTLTSVEINGRDSLNLFVRVTINPNSEQLPFIVKDSITFLTNGNRQKVILHAYGQNAHFLKDAVLTEDTVWDNKLPYVIYNTIRVNPDKVLTITKGSRVYFHKDSEMIIAGSLKVKGDLKDSVVFASDRLERIYADESGQWKGIRLLRSSTNNVINFALIKNAIIGIQVDSSSRNSNPKVLLVNTIIKNMELAGLISNNSDISAFNNIITNCGKYLVYALNGGRYDFKQNTFVNYNFTFPRNTQSLYFSNGSQADATTYPMSIELVNNIIWGNLQEELQMERKGSTAFTQIIKNNLIKTQNKDLDQTNILNADPLFKNQKSSNFLLIQGSPAINKGADLSSDPQFGTWLNRDLRGHLRLFPSDLGSYELL